MVMLCKVLKNLMRPIVFTQSLEQHEYKRTFETSTVAGLETWTNTLSPFRYVVVKFRCVVVVGGVRGLSGGEGGWSGA